MRKPEWCCKWTALTQLSESKSEKPLEVIVVELKGWVGLFHPLYASELARSLFQVQRANTEGD